MGLSTKITLVLFISFVTACSACTSVPDANSNSNSNTANLANASNSNKTNDSLEDLRSLIQVPFEPEEVTWRQTDDNKRLFAVLLYIPAEHKTLVSKFTGAGTPVQVNVEQWFPTELTTMGETSGEMTIEGKAFPATEFYNPPYVAGNAILIPETNYVILDLQSN
jgi:hypothetical protein